MTGKATADKESIKKKLSSFFANNTTATFHEEDGNFSIRYIWNYDTLELPLDVDEQENILEALQSVFFPPRLTALYHIEERALEVIYTPFPDPSLMDRNFEFEFNGIQYDCGFAEASEALVTLSRHFTPIDIPSNTEYRNLQSYFYYHRLVKEGRIDDVTAKKGGNEIKPRPTSFWVKSIEWSEDYVLKLCKNLNFFMYYFDHKTPRILIHEETQSESIPANQLRFVFDEFPKSIRGKPLDGYMLDLLDTAIEGDPFQRFLYCFQIIEYCSFYYIKESTRKAVERIIVAPDAVSKPTRASQNILEVLTEDRMNDDQKINHTIQECVDADVLWREIETNKNFFTASCDFDGGFSLPPLLKEHWTSEDFRGAWIPKFPDQIRKIRNALVHGREARMSKVILPSNYNAEKVRFWNAPVLAAAMQVILHTSDGS